MQIILIKGLAAPGKTLTFETTDIDSAPTSIEHTLRYRIITPDGAAIQFLDHLP